jgi:tRNA-modifying protein YgfZ
MNPQWQAFLNSRGAQIADDGGIRFPGSGDPRLGRSEDCALFDLSHLGLIAARGEDADAFLQGQLTNDIRELSPTHTQLSSHCSPKGRMLASFRVLRLGRYHLPAAAPGTAPRQPEAAATLCPARQGQAG